MTEIEQLRTSLRAMEEKYRNLIAQVAGSAIHAKPLTHANLGSPPREGEMEVSMRYRKDGAAFECRTSITDTALGSSSTSDDLVAAMAVRMKYEVIRAAESWKKTNDGTQT
jgi:hypothetical protein